MSDLMLMLLLFVALHTLWMCVKNPHPVFWMSQGMYFQVNTGNVAISYRSGQLMDSVYFPGRYFKFHPLLQTVHFYNTKQSTLHVPIKVKPTVGETFQMGVTLEWRHALANDDNTKINATALLHLVHTYGQDFQSSTQSLCSRAGRTIVRNKTVEELMYNPDIVGQACQQALRTHFPELLWIRAYTEIKDVPAIVKKAHETEGRIKEINAQNKLHAAEETGKTIIQEKELRRQIAHAETQAKIEHLRMVQSLQRQKEELESKIAYRTRQQEANAVLQLQNETTQQKIAGIRAGTLTIMANASMLVEAERMRTIARAFSPDVARYFSSEIWARHGPRHVFGGGRHHILHPPPNTIQNATCPASNGGPYDPWFIWLDKSPVC
jgi:hypothetical protein